MKADVEQAVNELIRLGIVQKDEIASAFEKYPESGSLEDRDALGDFLEQIGLLTAYQARLLRDKLTEDLVMDNYLILDRLGEGGMGKVFRARHKRMRRLAAIKILNPEIQDNPDYLQRFQREVESLARLNHPNVIQAYDADIGKFGSYLVLEFVEGNDLEKVVRKSGPFPVDKAVDAIIQSARALQYVHDQGMVHRDIKPQNLMRDREGNIKVADLGLVRLVEKDAGVKKEATPNLTAEFTIAGTLEYMAPEQAEDTSKVDHRADIYSLGCSLHFILSGQEIYQGKTVIDKLIAHRSHPIPDLRGCRPDLPERLQAIFTKMVAKFPQDRYQTMSEVAQDLETLRSTQVLSTKPMPAMKITPEESFAPTAFLDSTQHTIALTPPPPSGEVLLIEPSRLQGMMISTQLKSLGLNQVHLVATAAEGMAYLEKGGLVGVLCSQHLADCKGIELAQRLRTNPAYLELPFILITSNLDQEIQDASSRLNIKMLRKPFTPEALKQALALGSKTTPPGTGGATELISSKVLLVDDSTFARRRMKGILNQMGYPNVMEAGNGAEGLAMVKNHTFLFIVSDYHMPVLDGKEMLEKIRLNPNMKVTPVILITSEPDSFQLDSVRKLPFCKVLSKSIDCSALEKEVRGFLGQGTL